MANGNNNDYKLEFRSIDPARRSLCNDDEYCGYVHGLNSYDLEFADLDNEKKEKLKVGLGLKEDGVCRYSFVIRPYQRGFRWDADVNVRKLISDLFDYSKTVSRDTFDKLDIRNNDEITDKDFDFYCLQTLTVKQECDGRYEVIDGQQRLTCVYLLYKMFHLFKNKQADRIPYNIIYKRNNEDQEINFSTEIENFFATLQKEYFECSDGKRTIGNIIEANNKLGWTDRFKTYVEVYFNDELMSNPNCKGSYSIDLYYVRQAIIEIAKFVVDGGKTISDIDRLCACVERSVYFLWYEVPADDESDSGVETFLKINTGSIPLTNAELIKSLVLRKQIEESDDHEKIKNRSRKWEAIEQDISRDELWAFIAGNSDVDTRIEFLLDVYARQKSEEGEGEYKGNTELNKYELFDWFNKYRKNKPDDVLKGIEIIRDQICEWYDDVEIYHYVGLLTVFLNSVKLNYFKENKEYIKQEAMIKDLLLTAGNNKRNDFVQILKDKIIACLKDKSGKPTKLSWLVSDKDAAANVFDNSFMNFEDVKGKPIITAILWLMNVHETINSVDNMDKDIICRRFPFAEALSKKWSLEHIFPQKPDKAKDGKKAVEDFLAYCDECKDKGIKYISEIDEHKIKNLALLIKENNTALKNAPLAIKRNKLISEIGHQSFVPPSTVNAFLLFYCYNKKCDEKAAKTKTKDKPNADDWTNWTVTNAEAYEAEIISMLEQYE